MSRPAILKTAAVDAAARITKAADEGNCATLIRLREPVIVEGKTMRWRVKEERILRDLLAKQESRTILREAFAETEAEARETLKRMVNESLKSPDSLAHQKEADRFKRAVKADADREAKLLNAPAPEGGKQISQFDLKDYKNARVALLREKYPRLVDAMERKAPADEIERAYVLDVAELTGQIHAENVPADRPFIQALAKATAPRKGTAGKARQMAALRTEILRGWFSDRYCWMSNIERAEAIRKLGVACTPESVRKEIFRLKLATKRADGPPVRKIL